MILCLGEAIVDLVCERRVASLDEATSFAPHFGGASANVAMAIARAGGDASLGGGAGDDAWGRWLRTRLADGGCDLRWFQLVAGLNTPLAIVTFDPDGEPRFSVYGEGIEAGLRALTGDIEEAVDAADAIVLGSNTLVGEPERQLTLEARRLALAAEKHVLFDPNIRAHRWEDLEEARRLCRGLCEGAFLVRANHAEGMFLTGDPDPVGAAETLCELGARLAVVTRGADGAVMAGEANADAKGADVALVSPLGAGDAFMGTLAAGLADLDWSAERATEALPVAVRAGAEACTHWGAQP